MADDILRTSSGQFALAGFSLGSQVALQTMSLVRERVERLALMSATRGGVPPNVGSAIQRTVNVIETRGLDEYLEEAFSTYVAVSNRGDAGLKRSFVEMAHGVGRDAGLRQMRALLALALRFTVSTKSRARLWRSAVERTAALRLLLMRSLQERSRARR
jgi:pimeloyl-ACP methyl ester carboxylesterase